MSTESYTTETRELVVTGHIWSGHKSRMEYTLKDDQKPVTLADAKRIAGDFESLEKARIRTIHREIKETVTQTHLK